MATTSSATSKPSKSRSFGIAYHTCRPDEYLVKSGMFVGREIVRKNAVKWPFQRITLITLAPRNYSFTLHCISKDLVPFDLPVVFTIGPHDPQVDMDGFRRYASKMSAMTGSELHDVVMGCIHGQTRLYAAGLTVLEMFGDRDSFKMHVQERIAKELQSFGLQVFNANVAEMRDSIGNEYFSSLKQKAISGAVNDARVQVATAKKMGDIGETQNQADAEMRVAEISALVTQQSNIAKQTKAQSNMELALVDIECKKEEDLKRIEGAMQPKNLEAELQTSLNKLNGIKQQEFLRATELAKTLVTAEQKVAEAEAKAQSQKVLADADLYTAQLKADAELYAAKKRAEGITATMEAQAEGMRKLLVVADPELVKFHLAIQHGLFEKLADKTAAAVQGMQPKINIWNTGGGGDAQAADAYSPLQKLFTSLPPMLDAIQTQTNVKLPSWMPSSQPAPPATKL